MSSLNSLMYEIENDTIYFDDEYYRKIISSKFIAGTYVSSYLVDLIFSDDVLYQYAVMLFSGDVKSFEIASNASNASVSYTKVELYNSFQKAFSQGNIKIDERVRSRYRIFKDMIHFNYFAEKHAADIFTISVDNTIYKISVKTLLDFINMDTLRLVAILEDNKPTINGVPKAHFLYALKMYFAQNNLEKDYVLTPNVCNNLALVKNDTYVDLMAVNTHLKTEDQLYKDIIIDKELKEYILAGIPDSFSLLEKAIYVYIKLCRTLTYNEEFFAMNQVEAIDKLQDPKLVNNINLNNREAVCFQVNLLLAAFLALFGIHFKSHYKGTDKEEYTNHPFLEVRCDEMLLRFDSVTSIFSGDLFNAKLNRDLVGIKCLNINPKTLDKFNKTVARIYEYIKTEELFEYNASLQVDTLDRLLNDYKRATNSYQEIPMNERFSLFLEKINSIKALQGIDVYSYIIKLTEILFTPSERQNQIAFVIVKNNNPDINDKKCVPIGVIKMHEKGFSQIPYENSYYLINSNRELKPISYYVLANMFKDGTLEYIEKKYVGTNGDVLQVKREGKKL